MKNKTKYFLYPDIYGELTVKVCFYITQYWNNDNMAIILITDEGEEWDSLTTNLDMLMPNYAFIKNDEAVEKVLINNGFAKKTGTNRQSDFNDYDLYEFDLEKMKPYIHPMSDYFMVRV